MKIMLDNSPNQLAIKEKKFNFDMWQLQTPLSRRKVVKPYGLDNGCFAKFEEKTWRRMLNDARTNRPAFVCLPDIVGSAARTAELFDIFFNCTKGLPRALVLQDGINEQRIPWNDIEAVFIGGTDKFKISTECLHACKTAKMLGKWIHVGRVNTPDRLSQWMELGDSIDGSGISKYDYMLEAVIKQINFKSSQLSMSI